MKIRSVLAQFLFFVVAGLFTTGALASTYVWVGDVSKLHATKPRLLQTAKVPHDVSTCAYASHGFKLGDVLVLEDIKVTMVCARTSDGTMWLQSKLAYPLRPSETR